MKLGQQQTNFTAFFMDLRRASIRALKRIPAFTIFKFITAQQFLLNSFHSLSFYFFFLIWKGSCFSSDSLSCWLLHAFLSFSPKTVVIALGSGYNNWIIIICSSMFYNLSFKNWFKNCCKVEKLRFPSDKGILLKI